MPEPSSLSKPLEYLLPPEPMPQLNDLALAREAETVAEREQYARLWMPDADTSDAESRKRRQAEAIVQRAIEAMGGREALLAIRSLQMRVWVLAREHYVPIAFRPYIIPTNPYLYPVSERRCTAQGCQQTAVSVADLAARLEPFPPFGYRNPARTLSAYQRHCASEWVALSNHLPPRTVRLRLEGQSLRWHFLEEYQGEGILLSYLGNETQGGEAVDVIVVDDRKYGAYRKVGFSRQTGLLAQVVEGITEWERLEMQERRPGARPPTWTTQYGDYHRVAGVLLPHRLVCTSRDTEGRAGMPFSVTLYLQMTANGAPLPDEVPLLLDQDR